MRRLAAHPAVADALAAGRISESWGRQICEWTELLPEDHRGDADEVLLGAAAGGAELSDLEGLAEEIRKHTAKPDDNGDDGFDDRGLHLARTFRGAGKLNGDLNAPRGASLYSRRSREELEGRFLGLMAYLDPKGEGDNSMPGNQRSCPGVWGEVLGDPRDMAKAGLPESQSPGDVSPSSAGKTPGTGAVSCVGIVRWPAHPSGCGAIPSEGIQGDEWDA